MKTLIKIFTCILLYQPLFGQKMEVYFGMQNRNDWARDIIELYDKGFYITGGFEGDEFIKGWNIKTDINLGFIYDNVMEHGIGTVAPRASISDDNGNIYITGSTTYPAQWPFVTKIDSCGNKVWCKILQYDTEFEDGVAKDVLISDDNEIIILADFDSEDEVDKVHLIGLSENGEVLWFKPYASKTDHPWIREPNVYSIMEINKDYYISGFCYWPYPNDTTHFFLRALFIGIDSLFEEKWILPFAPLDSIFGVSFNTIPLSDSVLMGVGVRSIVYQGLLMFYNKDGEDLGYHGIDNDQLGQDVNGSDIRDVAMINDTLFLTASLFGPDYGGNPGGEFIVSINNNIYGYHSRPDTHIPSIIKTYDNNFVIATNIEETKGDDDIYVYKIDENLNDVPFDPSPHNYDSLCPGGIQSGTIDLTSCFVWTDIGEAPSPKEYYSFIATIPITAYPNPAEKEITLAFENTEHHTNLLLECYNIYGQKVHNEKIWKGQQQTKLDLSGYAKGLYFAVVKSNGKVAGTGRFVRR